MGEMKEKKEDRKIPSASELYFRKREMQSLAEEIGEILLKVNQNRELFQEHENGEFIKTFDAVENILMHRHFNKEPDLKDFKRFIRALNIKKGLRKPHPSDYGLPSSSFIPNPPNAPYTERGLAVTLERFLKCFVNTPQLKKFNPFDICPYCGTLFAKKRKSKAYCSNICKSAAYNELMGPEYFREKADKLRKAKRNPK